MGYPPSDAGQDEESLLRDQLDGLPVDVQAHGPPARRTLLLTAPGESPWRTGPMVLMNVRLLRRLLRAAANRIAPGRARRRNRIDLRV